MRNKTTMRRSMNHASTSSWRQNRNTIRHTPKTLGKVSQGFILALLVIVFGLIYTTQGTRSTNYDYELNKVENKIAELEAEKENLAVERARLTSIATAGNNEVAKAMEDAKPVGYAD